MKRYLSHCNDSHYAQEIKDFSTIERTALLLTLLSDRTIPRFICAPKRYGKSLLAYQYANCAFSSAEVLWVDSYDPTFISDLDAQSFELPDEIDTSIKLVVFDEVPFLNQLRQAHILALVKQLCELNLEVIITTSFRLNAESYENDKMIVDAQDLLLSDEEMCRLGGAELDYTAIDNRIVSWGFGSEEMKERLVGVITSERIHGRLDAIARLMLVLGEGTMSEIRIFPFDIQATDAANLKRDYPHCGIGNALFSFKALKLSAFQRFSLLQAHIDDLVSFTANHDRTHFLDVLLQVLKHHREWEVMSLVALNLCMGDQKTRAIQELVPHILFEGMPCLALRLLKEASETHSSTNTLILAEMTAYAMLRDEDRCRALFERKRGKFSAVEEAFAASIVMRSGARLKDRDRACFLECCNTCSDIQTSVFVGVSDANNKVVSSPMNQDTQLLMCAMLAACFESPERGAEVCKAITSSGISLHSSVRLLSALSWFICQNEQAHALSGAVDQARDVDSIEGLRDLRDQSLAHQEADWTQLFHKSVKRLLKRVGMILPANWHEAATVRQLVKSGLYSELELIPEGCGARYQETCAILRDQARMYQQSMAAPCRSLIVSGGAPSSSSVVSGQTSEASIQAAALNAQTAAVGTQVNETAEQASVTVRQTAATMGQTVACVQADAADELTAATDVQVAADSQLSIRVFGGFEMTVGGMKIPTKKKFRNHAKALMTLLLIHRNRDLPREWVESTIWSLSHPQGARQSFYNIWSYAKRTLRAHGINDAFMDLTRGIIRMDTSALRCDLVDLDAVLEQNKVSSSNAEEVLSLVDVVNKLYQGQLLPGINVPQIATYRTTYNNKVISFLHDAAQRLNKLGQTLSAERVARQAFSLDTTREDTCFMFMKVQHALGQRSGAIMTFLNHRQSLVDQFGIDPSKKLSNLYEEILGEVS